MKELFGIDDSIFKYNYKKHRAYITKIDFGDRSETDLSGLNEEIVRYEDERPLHNTEVDDIRDKLNISDEKLYDGK